MLYVFISILVFITSFFLFKKVSGTMSIQQMNFISYNFYFNLVLLSFLGVNIVILGLDDHYLLYRVNNFSIKQSAYFSVILVLILLPLSMLFISFIFRFKSKQEWDIYTGKCISEVLSKDDKAVFITLLIFTFISFSSILYTFFSIRMIPFFYLLFDSLSGDAARVRITASREFNGIVYIRNIFGIMLTPILSYIAYSYSIKSKYIGWRVLFLVLLILSILILTYDLSKAPVLVYLLSFIFIRVYIYGRVNFKNLIKYGMAALILVVFLYEIIMGYDSNFLNINSGPIGRLLLGQIMGLYFHFMYFPDLIPFLGGSGFSSIFTSLYGIETESAARIVMEVTRPGQVEAGTAGVMNTLFIAELYANFGWLGIVLGIICVGFIMQLLYIFFIRVPKNPITIAMFTYYTYSLPLTGGFWNFIYNPGMLILIALMVIFYFMSKIIDKILIIHKP